MRYRLHGYTSTDVFNATGSTDNYESFLEAFADDCRDDFAYPEAITFVSGDADGIVFEVPDQHDVHFFAMIAEPAPNILERLPQED